MKQLTQKCNSLLNVILLSILFLVPFHAFFTTWLGSNVGGLLVIRAWKEFLLAVALILVVVLLANDPALRRRIFKDKIVISALVFATWLLLATALMSRDLDSLALGLAIQLRIFAIFIVGMVVAFYRPPSKKLLDMLLLVPFIGVVTFGLMQLFILPYDFLKHFGYQKDLTIPPFFTIDSQLDNLRIASTLRGPNPLGVYLILPILVVVEKLFGWLRGFWPKQAKHVILFGALFVGSVITLYGSHSRGAWVATVVSVLAWVALSIPKKWLFVLAAASFVTGSIAGAALYINQDSSFVQNVILHDNPKVGPESNSNQGHSKAIENGINDIVKEPVIGCGSGCAGPASVHNQLTGVKIAENYFIQTAQESGIIGLVLLITSFGLVAIELYKKRSDSLAVVLLASFIGINVASMFAHSWADDTIAYVWWGLAGLVIGSYNHLGSGTASAKHPRTSAPKSSRPSS